MNGVIFCKLLKLGFFTTYCLCTMLSNIILVIVSFSKLLKAAADRIMHEATLKGWGGDVFHSALFYYKADFWGIKPEIGFG